MTTAVAEASARGGPPRLHDVRARQLLALPVWALSFALLIGGDILPAFAPLRSFMMASRAGMLLTLLGVVVLVLASRMSASSARQARALRPGERPVLYLRSFKADQSPTATAADEETLSRIFRTVGPFVALERPGELLPNLGSAKLSAENDDWQQVILDQIAGAELIVLNVGSTPSFMWEVQRVLERADPLRVLVYFSLHASEAELRGIYALFRETAAEVIPHPFPPVDDIGTQRFLRFDEERRPHLFGAIDTPKTAWRKVLAVASFGLALIPMRPFVAESRRARMSAALEPVRARFDPVGSPSPLCGRLTTAVGCYLGGLAALLPMLAWNAWQVGRRRSALWAVAMLPLIALGPVNDVVGFFALAFAVAVYLGWSLLAPSEVMRHLAFGGRTVKVVPAAVVIAAASAATIFLPHGIRMRVADAERSAVIDVEAVRSLLDPGMEIGADPARVELTKSALLDGSYSVVYQLESSDVIVVSELARSASGDDLDLAEELAGEFPGFNAERTSRSEHAGWTVRTYTLSVDGGEAGVGVLARKENMMHRSTLGGLRVPADLLTALVRPRLDAAAEVRGLYR